ncbi:MAG: GNAT family acetyltransferase [Candidatus Neomarinimicrobiota bacterium]
MEIREYLKIDERDVLILWEKCGLIVPWNNALLDIKRKLNVNRELFLVGVGEGKVIATAMGGYDGHRGWINYLAVHPDLRRYGFGREIMEAVEHLLKKMGCPKINLQVRASNKDVISFYQSLDYKDDNVISLGKRLIVDLKD